jgi:uncharacterized protein YndB with AHSA1/START domain
MNAFNDPKATLATERLLPFSPQQIFSAIQDAEKIAQWWGPKGFTNTFEIFDFKPGGRWVFVMHGPDGSNYPNENVFREITPNREVVIDHIHAPEFRLTITLTPRGKRTRIHWIQCFETRELMQRLRLICEPANEQNLDRLEQVLASTKA